VKQFHIFAICGGLFYFAGQFLNWRDLWQALYFVSCEKINEKPRHLRDAVCVDYLEAGSCAAFVVDYSSAPKFNRQYERSALSQTPLPSRSPNGGFSSPKNSSI